LTKYKYYEGGATVGDVGAREGFAFARRRRGCFCVPAAGESCSHASWTGEIDRGSVQRAKPAQAGGATRVTRQAARRGGPSATYRDSIDENSLICMPGDEEDETADGESIWYANALGPQVQSARRWSLTLYSSASSSPSCMHVITHQPHLIDFIISTRRRTRRPSSAARASSS